MKQIALAFVVNGYGSEYIGELLAPLIEAGIAEEGLRALPVQAKPVIMNVKGASAAGKSTLRPLQQQLARRIGVNLAGFRPHQPGHLAESTCSTTIHSARPNKYAGMLTGHEVEIIDQKLDRYMAAKARAGRITHLLIDRFRFDSFAAQPGEEEGGRLLTRFGDLVYMFFVVTPPEATVERAWGRGLEFGRYKAVDDLLDHNVEAFTGMPRLFFTWALNSSKRVSLRVPGQLGSQGRAAEDHRLRLERRDDRPGHQGACSISTALRRSMWMPTPRRKSTTSSIATRRKTTRAS